MSVPARRSSTADVWRADERIIDHSLFILLERAIRKTRMLDPIPAGDQAERRITIHPRTIIPQANPLTPIDGDLDLIIL